MKELVFACMMGWATLTPTSHGKPMGDDFVCFQPAPMMRDFLKQTHGWKNVLHERGPRALAFFLWFNSIPPTTSVVADEVIIFGHSNKNFYWIWVIHKGCWLNLFKAPANLMDVWIKKRKRKEAKDD